MDAQRITLEPGKRGGRPCVRNLRITVYEVLEMLAGGMSEAEILEDFPELEAAMQSAKRSNTMSKTQKHYLRR
jgi:uncharacterized protein (DUF433 family)